MVTENHHFYTNHPTKGKFGKRNHLAKKVYQYDKSMKLIKIFDCFEDVEKIGGFSKESVSTCCHGRTKTSGGFIWKL